jgi:uncharacterized coiled-coil protein SlyX
MNSLVPTFLIGDPLTNRTPLTSDWIMQRKENIVKPSQVLSQEQTPDTEYLVFALTEMGFTDSESRRAVLATANAGIAQAIEYAMSNSSRAPTTAAPSTMVKSDKQNVQPNFSASSQAVFVSPSKKAGAVPPAAGKRKHVVEGPNGQLFELSDPAAQLVELPDGRIVEVGEGQMIHGPGGTVFKIEKGTLVEVTDYPRERMVSKREPTSDFPKPPAASDRRMPAPASGASSIPVPQPELARVNGAQEVFSSTAAIPGHIHPGASLPSVSDDSESQRRLKDLDEAAKQKSQEVSELEAKIAQLNARAGEAEMRLVEKEERLAAQQRLLASKSAEIEQGMEDLERKKRGLRQAIEEFEASKQTAPESSSSSAQEGESKSKEMLDGVPLTITFKNVELGPMIGSGSFAEVFKGSVRTPCAVKRLKSNFGREGMQVTPRFCRWPALPFCTCALVFNATAAGVQPRGRRYAQIEASQHCALVWLLLRGQPLLPRAGAG